MKITIKHYGVICAAEIEDGCSIPEVVDIFVGLLLTTGWHKDSIISSLAEYVAQEEEADEP